MWLLIVTIHWPPRSTGLHINIMLLWSNRRNDRDFSTANPRQVLKPQPSPGMDGASSFCHRGFGVRYVISSSNHKQHNYVDLNMKGRQEAQNGGCIEWKCNCNCPLKHWVTREWELPQLLSALGYGMVLLLLYVRILILFEYELAKKEAFVK